MGIGQFQPKKEESVMYEPGVSQPEVSMLPGERAGVEFKKDIDNGRVSHITLCGNGLTAYRPVLCFHEDNRVNRHGFGLRTYIIENIYSPKDNHCQRCGGKCVEESSNNAELADGRLIQAGIGTGFFVYDARHNAVFEITKKEAHRTFLQ